MIERRPLRAPVQKEILARIADRRLPAGSRINESHLAADLGLSRTPLREAMLGLEADGFLASDMGRGFMVPALSAREFTEIQAVLGRLAPFALGLSLPLPPARVMELSNLLGRARLRVGRPGPEQAAALADLVHRWSALCLESCPNGVLRADIARLEARSHRYWSAAVIGGFEPSALVAGYDGLYELIRTRQAVTAIGHWENHLQRFAAAAAAHLPAP